jgi:hypothetical protein
LGRAVRALKTSAVELVVRESLSEKSIDCASINEQQILLRKSERVRVRVRLDRMDTA